MASSRLQRRLLCLKASKRWAVKQVTKSNFDCSLEDFKTHISNSDFIAISLRKTGSFSAPWQRILPIDTPETAYSKAKYSAERFQILQFAICPFSIKASNKVIAYPYNFHLFPRDELKIGMPSYSFSCQPSYLTAMAREGVDFNTCIYDGISYLSRAQETAAKSRKGNTIPSLDVVKSSSTSTIADTLFVDRIRLRIKNWRAMFKDSSKIDSRHEVLVKSLRKIALGGEEFRSRPCMTIDVCSEHQVQLLLEMLVNFSDDVVPLLVPSKGGNTQAVRVVLTNSKEDKDLFERELQNLEEEQNKKLCGFREVIDLISASQKPVVSHNSLNEFVFIHSKFIAPLPPQVGEFLSSMSAVFPCVLDVNNLMKGIRPLKKVTNAPAALSLKDHPFPLIDVEIPHQAMSKEDINHGHHAIRICLLFAKSCSMLQISKITVESGKKHLSPALERFVNVFNPCSTNLSQTIDEDISVWTNNTRKVNCDHLVFMWGFSHGTTAGKLKSLLRGSHEIFSRDFDVKLLDKSCAIVVFWQPGFSEALVNLINSERVSGSLREIVSEGVRVTSYETYKKICRLGLWELNLAESMARALTMPDFNLDSNSVEKLLEINWCSDDMINLEDL